MLDDRKVEIVQEYLSQGGHRSYTPAAIRAADAPTDDNDLDEKTAKLLRFYIGRARQNGWHQPLRRN